MSSNVDSPPAPTYLVVSRELSIDLARAATDESSRELGKFGAEELARVLDKLLALDPAQVGDADPQIVVSAHRGRFVIKPARGKLLLREANDGQQTYFELPADQVSSYLEGHDPVAATDEPDEPLVQAAPRRSSSAAGAFALFAVAFSLVSSSAYFTWRSDDFDSESKYAAVGSPAEVTAVRQRVVGTYAAPEDAARQIEVRADGTVVYKEFGPSLAVTYERSGPFAITWRKSDQHTVLRVAGLGTIDLRDAVTIEYARDVYKHLGYVEAKILTR